jgi:hypothetical protein
MAKQSVNLRLQLCNPGHIEIGKKPWNGQSKVQKHRRFVTFDSNVMGIRAIAVTLQTYYDKRVAKDGSKIDTIREVLERWAPAFENNVARYSDTVVQLTEIGADETINVYDWATMRGLVRGIIRHENGGDVCTLAEIDAGLRAAGLQPPERGLAKSRIGRGAAVAVGTGATTAITAAAEQIEPYIPLFTKVTDFIIQNPRTVMLVIAGVLVTIGVYTAYARWDMRRRGIG